MDTALGAGLAFLAIGAFTFLTRKHQARWIVETYRAEWEPEDREDEQRWLEFRNGLIGVGSLIIGIVALVAWFMTR